MDQIMNSDPTTGADPTSETGPNSEDSQMPDPATMETIPKDFSDVIPDTNPIPAAVDAVAGNAASDSKDFEPSVRESNSESAQGGDQALIGLDPELRDSGSQAAEPKSKAAEQKDAASVSLQPQTVDGDKVIVPRFCNRSICACPSSCGFCSSSRRIVSPQILLLL